MQSNISHLITTKFKLYLFDVGMVKVELLAVNEGSIYELKILNV